MIREVFEYFVDQAAAELGVNCVKGFPDWARPAMTNPSAALEFAVWSPGTPGRIGQKQARQNVGFRLYVFARNEPELGVLLDRLADWSVQGEAPVVEGRRLSVAWQDGQRHISETGTQQEAHGFVIFLTAAWSTVPD